MDIHSFYRVCAQSVGRETRRVYGIKEKESMSKLLSAFYAGEAGKEKKSVENGWEVMFVGFEMTSERLFRESGI